MTEFSVDALERNCQITPVQNRFSRRRKRMLVIALACAATSRALWTADILVSNEAEMTAALSAAHPGDAIVLKNGVWSNLNVNKQDLAGTLAAPITIRAQTPGQ